MQKFQKLQFQKFNSIRLSKKHEKNDINHRLKRKNQIH
jgi:hypothetical protein